MRRIDIDTVKLRLYSVWGDVVTIDESTYRNYRRTKCRFIDKEFGEFWAWPQHVCNGHSSFRKIERQKATFEKKYGTKTPQKIFRSKAEKTNIDRYGGVSPTKNPAVIERTRNTRMSRYGAFKSPAELIKTKNTNIAKYGVPYPAQNQKVALKTARSNNQSQVKHHWKTNEQLVCVGSYEAKTVDYLNKHKVEFKWQPSIFTMPNGKTYRPDLYLISEDRWVEIKGWMRKDAQEKWEWFSSNYKAELWDKNKLKFLGVL